MPEQDVEKLREENIRLRSALEEALLFIEEVASGGHEKFEAEALVPVISDALTTDGDEQR